MSGLCLKIMSQHILPTYHPAGDEDGYRQSLSFKRLHKKIVKCTDKHILQATTVSPVTLSYFIRCVNYGQISKSHHLGLSSF